MKIEAVHHGGGTAIGVEGDRQVLDVEEWPGLRQGKAPSVGWRKMESGALPLVSEFVNSIKPKFLRS
jgi:hypothetical protein